MIVGNLYKHRLLLLASFLEQLPTERFDYRHWVGANWQGKSDLSCGTTACALGWATTIPELQEAGLTMTLRTNHDFNSGHICLRDNQYISTPGAGMEIFGLNLLEFNFLFHHSYHKDGEYSPGGEATSKEVAEHIRKFVANKYPGE